MELEAAPPTRSADVTLQRVGQEAILYDRRLGRAHVINDSAARIWDLCDGQTSTADITKSFAAAYDMTEAAVRDDVAQILTTFRTLEVLN